MTPQFPIGFNQEFQRTRNAQIEECDLGANVMSFLDAQKNVLKEMQLSPEEIVGLLQSDNALAQSIHKLDAPQAYAAVHLGLIVWKLHQKEARAVDLTEDITGWIKSSMQMQNLMNRGSLSVFILEQTLSLAPHVPAELLTNFMTTVLSTIENHYKPWGRSHLGSNEMRGSLLGLMGEMALACGAGPYKADPHRGIYCAFDYWKYQARRVFAERWQGNHETIATALVRTQLPKTHMYEFLLTTAAQVWTVPAVHSVLFPLLGENDLDNFKRIPWATTDGSEEINRKNVQLYCPSLYPLLDLVTTSEDWRRMIPIELLMVSWHKEKSNLKIHLSVHQIM